MKQPPASAPKTPSGASSVLAAVRAEQAAEEAAAVRQLELTVAYAAAHRVESAEDAAGFTIPGSDQEIALAGEGAPLVSEFAVVEYAAATGRSVDAARRYVGDCLELAHRLPRTWAHTRAGRVPGWRARRIAAATKPLPFEGAAWVDAQVAPVAGKIGVGELDRIIAEALARFDPEQSELRRLDALDRRRVDVFLTTVTDGTVCNADLHGTLDAADALDLDATLSEMAAELAALGCPDSLDARRAHALGQLARGEQPLDYADRYGTSVGHVGRGTGDDEAARCSTGHMQTGHRGADHGQTSRSDRRSRSRRPRQMVLHVRLTEASLRGIGDGIGTLTTTNGRILGPVTVEQVQEWCGSHPDTQITVKPILDLDELITSHGYQPSPRLRDQITTLHPRCVFPWCTRPTANADLDHITPWQDNGGGGKTDSHGLAPLCRLHHRAKTHDHWVYVRIAAGEYLWTSPGRLRFHVEVTSTTEVTSTAGPPGHHSDPRPDQPPGHPGHLDTTDRLPRPAVPSGHRQPRCP